MRSMPRSCNWATAWASREQELGARQRLEGRCHPKKKVATLSWCEGGYLGVLLMRLSVHQHLFCRCGGSIVVYVIGVLC